MNAINGGKSRSARTSVGPLGAATLVALAACSGGNLGINGGRTGDTGGVTGGDTDNTSGTAGSENDAGTAAGGGTAGTGGAAATGGAALAGGGAIFVDDPGGQGATGGQDGGGVDAIVPYPLEPTTPIAANCSCEDDSNVCNAAGKCVPRCEPDGTCAVWKVDRSIRGTLTSSDTLYFVLAAERDLFGNPVLGDAGHESLWKAHYPELAPTRVALLEGEANVPLFHLGAKTYLLALKNLLSVVDESGTVATHEAPSELQFFSVSRDGAFGTAANGRIDQLPLTQDGWFGTEFSTVVPAHGVPSTWLRILATDRVWQQYADQLCSYDPSDFGAPAHCVGNYARDIIGAVGSRAVVYEDLIERVQEVDVDSDTTRSLTDTFWFPGGGGPDKTFCGGVLADDFVTMLVYDNTTATQQIGRFPTQRTAEPTFLISDAVAAAMSNTQGVPGISPPVVTSDAAYWTQTFASDLTQADSSRYIFRAPLAQ